MENTNNIDNIIQAKRAVTFGKFDGLHLGHQKLIKKIASKKNQGMIPTVFTFDTPPDSFLQNNQRSNTKKALLTRSEKESLLELMGIDTIFEYPVTKESLKMTAKDFVVNIIKNKLNAEYIAVGEDFRFGLNRMGDVELLRKMSKTLGFSLDIVEKERLDGKIISSSLVREKLLDGKINEVNRLLGYEYSINGEIIKGNQLGRKWNVPTINILWHPDKLEAKHGVYFSRVTIKDNGGDREFFGMTNFGTKPTIKGEYKPGTETYLYGCDEDLYGKAAVVRLLHFRRSEQKFESVEMLKEAIYNDIEAGKKYFS